MDVGLKLKLFVVNFYDETNSKYIKFFMVEIIIINDLTSRKMKITMVFIIADDYVRWGHSNE